MYLFLNYDNLLILIVLINNCAFLFILYFMFRSFRAQTFSTLQRSQMVNALVAHLYSNYVWPYSHGGIRRQLYTSSVTSFAMLLYHFCPIILAKCWLVILTQVQLKEIGKQFGVHAFVFSFFKTLDKEGQVVNVKFLSNFNIFLNFFI